MHEEGFLFEERAPRHEDIVDKFRKRGDKKKKNKKDYFPPCYGEIRSGRRPCNDLMRN